MKTSTSIKFNRRTSTISPAATSGLSERVTRLRAQGKDIIGLSTGEPDFETPSHIKQAAIEAIERGETRYTATSGTAQLKAAVVDKFQRENHLQFSSEEVFVGSGVKQVLYNLLQTLVDDDDEVLFAAPYWVSYPEMVKAAGGKSVVIDTALDSHFKMTPQQLRSAITRNTKVFIFCSPGNPGGTAYSCAEITALAEVLLEHPDIWVISDDIYEHLLWTEEPFCQLLNVCPQLKSRTLIVNGVSKAFAMTGWRIGYGAGPEAVIKNAVKLQSHSTSGACSIAQAAAVAALNGPMDEVWQMNHDYKKRHDYLYKALKQFKFVKCKPSDGTFYLFVDVRDWIANVEGVSTDIEFVEYLIEKAGVAVVPGSAFGSPGYLRFSFATGMDKLQMAVERLRHLEDRFTES